MRVQDRTVSLRPRSLPLILAVVAALLAITFSTNLALALDWVVFNRDGKEMRVGGRVTVEAQDGGLLLQSRDGMYWRITPEELVHRTSDDEKFAPFSQEEMGKQILAELPDGFEVFSTRNYVIVHNTTGDYARWCGALFERLHRAFETYWRGRGFAVPAAEFPLAAIVFADRPSFAAYGKDELGENAQSIIGYYSLRTNRVNMYDLTGLVKLRQPNQGRRKVDIGKMLQNPQAAVNVATVVHEATHQIAFNRGLHVRFADMPLWASEGLAVYFETPDLNSDRGWRTIGAVNQPRLDTFRRYQAAGRTGNSLKSLICDDSRFRNAAQAGDAYAEAWALTYFLVNRHREQYTAYVKMLAAKPLLVWDEPDVRIKEFQAAFGRDLGKLDAEFQRYMQAK